MKKRLPSACRFFASIVSLALFLPALLLALPAQAALPEAKLTVVRPVIAGQSVSARMLATDADGDALTFQVVQGPAQGAVVVDDPATGAFTYTANADAKGRDLFTFQVQDAGGMSAVQIVHLTIQPYSRSVLAVGSNSYGALNIGGWREIVALAGGHHNTVGLKADGTAVAAGSNSYSQRNVDGWSDIVAVAVGDYHTVGLKADGKVVATGYNGVGAINVGSWSDIVGVVAGRYHTIGLKADGTLVATGPNGEGQCNVGDWSDIVAVAAGDWHTVGLKADGTVVAAGDNVYGHLDVGGWSGIVAVAGGQGHTVGLKADGTVVATGANESGQLNVDGWYDIVAVTAGISHTVGLKANGTVVAAGNNWNGLLNVGGWSDIVAVVGEADYTIGLKGNSAPVAADSHLFTEPETAAPIDLLALASDADGDVLTIASATNSAHGVVIDNGDGTVTYTPDLDFTGTDSFTYTVSDGFNGSATGTVTVLVSADWDGDGLPNLWETTYGFDPHDATGADDDPDGDGYTNLEEHQHGSDPNSAASFPPPAAKLTVVRPVVAGQSVSATMLARQTPSDTLTFQVVQVPQQGTVLVHDPATGAFTYTANTNAKGRDYFTFQVQDADGAITMQTVYLTIQSPGRSVVAMGDNLYGQLNVDGWRNIVELADGKYHTVGLKADGTVAATGGNGFGELNVDGWRNIVAVAGGQGHTVGLKDDGSVVATGASGYGQLNVGGWRNIVAVAASNVQTIGLKADGTVVATGDNRYGELNVSGWSDIVEVVAGASHTVGLKADGTVMATGFNQMGQLDVGGWSGIVGVVAGSWHTFGLKADGTVVATGAKGYSPPDVSAWRDIVALAAGGFHALGLKADGTVVGAGYNEASQLDVGGWRDIVAVAADGNYTLGLKANLAPTAADSNLFTEPETAAPIDLLALASDADGDTLSISAFSQGTNGAVIDNGGRFTYTPNLNFTGTDGFTYTVRDGFGGSATGTVTVHISADWDGDGLPNLWEIANGLDPHGATGVNGADGADGDPDGDGYTNLEEYQHGSDPNSGVSFPPPLAKLTVVRPVVAGKSVSATMLARQTTSDVLIFQVVQAPEQGTVVVDDPATGAFTYTAKGDAKGRDHFTFQAQGAGGTSAVQIVHLTIQSRGRSVVGTGSVDFGQLNVDGWRDIVAVAGGQYDTVGLKADGTAVTTGWTKPNVDGWSDIVAVAAGDHHIVGLKADGTLMTTGDNGSGQLDVNGWSDIVGVAAATFRTFGLKADGTVVATGDNGDRQLNVGGWRDIVAVVASDGHTAGLKADGTVVVTGDNGSGQLDVDGWRDIVAVAAGGFHTVGLTAGGTVVATGDNGLGQLDVGDWRDIVGVVAGVFHTVGLRADGTVVATGENNNRQLNVDSWRDIVEVVGGHSHTIGLKANKAPVAPEGNLLAEPGTAAPINLLALASDADGDTLGISAFGQGANGAVIDNGGGTFTYTPNLNFTGTDSFTYTVSDGYGGTATGTVTVFVYASLVIEDADGTVLDPSSPITVESGTTHALRFSGGSGQYDATVLRPDGTTMALVFAAGRFNVPVPATGAFAGDYVVTLKDAVTGSTQLARIHVPLKVEGERPMLLTRDDLRRDMEVLVRGARAGATLSLQLDGKAAAQGITLSAINHGVAEDGAAEGNPARFLIAVTDHLAVAVEAELMARENVAALQGAGIVRAVPATAHAGQVFGMAAEQIAGATVTLLRAVGAQPTSFWEDNLGRITTTTDAQGRFTFYAPPAGAGERHSLQVTALGYAAASAAAEDCIPAAPCTLTLDYETAVAQPTFTPPGGRYDGSVLATIGTTTMGATLRYTLDGTTPSRTHGTVAANGAAVQIDESATLKVFGYKDGLRDSDVGEASYVITAPAQGGAGGIGLPFLGLLGILAAFAGGRRRHVA